MKTVLLVSGGLDSFVAFYYLNKEYGIPLYDLVLLYIDYKGRYTEKEKKVCEFLYEKDFIIDDSINLGPFEQGEKAFIQNRNAYFALIASRYGNNIVMAGLKDDNVGDKSPEAFIKMEQLLNEINPISSKSWFTVNSPFWRFEKAEIIKWALNNGVKENYLLNTTSCYHPTEHYCGRCPACFRKYCAFLLNEIKIKEGFSNLTLVKDYIDRIDSFTFLRKESILMAKRQLGL